jgi:hypothetical protein
MKRIAAIVLTIAPGGDDRGAATHRRDVRPAGAAAHARSREVLVCHDRGADRVPRDRLLRVGFGFLVRPDGQYNTELSTTHQFKLPRRL